MSSDAPERMRLIGRDIVRQHARWLKAFLISGKTNYEGYVEDELGDRIADALQQAWDDGLALGRREKP